MKEGNRHFWDKSNVQKLFGRYKYFFLVIVVGMLFLMLPVSTEKETAVSETQQVEEDFSVDALEEQLREILSKISGAGSVDVMLTVESGMKRVFAQDVVFEQREGEIQKEMETVVISSGSGIEETVLVQQIYPHFQGALVVADGGGDPAVRLALTNAVAALTGLGADKISVCKGK